MLTFNEIEDCFPEHGGTTDDGAMICSAQWLHDFAHAVAAKEREACANIAESLKVEIGGQPVPNYGIGLWISEIIRGRSNV